MPPHGLNKQTLGSADMYGCDTPLHVCAQYGQVECMKLLLRSGADTNIKNAQDKTPLEVAQDLGYHACVELVIILRILIKFQVFIILFIISVGKCFTKNEDDF